ncbi:MAG: EamA/RhaT family transporter, partial [Burkholderiaceae bacterium]
LTGAVLGLIASLLAGFSTHDARGVWLLLAIGVTATLAQLAMTRAYARGHTLGTANLQYSAVIFATILGIVLFGDHIAASGWIGIAIIIASGIASTALTALKRPTQRAAETTDVEPTAEK